ncbi:hypothetical protein FQN49_006637, partial [Arthroderma sp. PD_2]
MPSIASLPPLPTKLSGLLSYIDSNPDTPVGELLEPYAEYDSVLRRLFAQEPSNPLLADNHINTLPLYDGNGYADLRVQARDLSSESKEVSDKYLLPLKNKDRKPNGSPAIVNSFKEFQTNFNLFSESSLSDLDWSNVVAAGSSVASALLTVPKEHGETKRQLRHFYHQVFAPASDVDLFIYGLNEEQALEKIKQIEQRIRDSILYETTTVRTKHTITIVSQYPTRHVQIVLRLYKSVSEILTGFDVDCSCVAYDGENVHVAPRAVASYITQANRIDLTRRSPSYENRLAKYSHRGFEVVWPQLERSRIDPTIFERSFMRTTGLARLLVLERLPTSDEREKYMQQRREERGRPPIVIDDPYKLPGNIKDEWENEVAEWVDEAEFSGYGTVSIPYGEKFHARKIEKLLYAKDLLLNSEWNNQNRGVNLHRHPAFFGNTEDVIQDCCGFCPKPVTPEDEEVFEKESKMYISGKVSFLKDDPGRQEIGSFHPITETDWTEMAYIGNTTRLFQGIVDNDLETIQEWLAQEDADPNRRDHTGRTALHLATMVSTPEVVQCLVEHGARLIARLADGRMALHLAATRGNIEIIRILLNKSEENEAAEEAKKDMLRQEARNTDDEMDIVDEDPERSDNGNCRDSDDGKTSFVTGSFVDVKKGVDGYRDGDNVPDEDNASEPDIIDINALAWDSKASPLHLAIIHGHIDTVKELVSSFGADVLLPIKLVDRGNNARAAILPLVLSLQSPREKATAMAETLLKLGATPAQADLTGRTPLHYFAASPYSELFDTLSRHDAPGVQRAINYLATGFGRYYLHCESALTVAIMAKNATQVSGLLNLGASLAIDFGDYMKVAPTEDSWMRWSDFEGNQKRFQKDIPQPIVLAAQIEQPLVALQLLKQGADPNTLTPDGFAARNEESEWRYNRAESLLDFVAAKILQLRKYKEPFYGAPPVPLKNDEYYLSPYQEGTYQMQVAKVLLSDAKWSFDSDQERYEKELNSFVDKEGLEAKKRAIGSLLEDYQALESEIIAKGGKTFKELFPDIKLHGNNTKSRSSRTSSRDHKLKIEFKFDVPDLTGGKRDGYIKLFEAAWSGDLDTIKSLTLEMWGPGKKISPLPIAVTDAMNFSPFSLAVFRGHLDVAKGILQIVRAQYKPKDAAKRAFRLESDADSDNDDSETSLQKDEPRITGDVVRDEFTIDNIGEEVTRAESDVSPLYILRKDCMIKQFLGTSAYMSRWSGDNLFKFAIEHDNVDLLRFLIDLGQSEVVNGVEDDSYTLIHPDELGTAIHRGHINCLIEIIRRTGAGLPLNKLVEDSGIELKRKPKYYQGLSVHGKKREDWAAAAGQETSEPTHTDSQPPLLLAVQSRNIATIEWFRSTAPKRHYMDYANANKQDKRLKALAQTDIGVEGSIQKWLSKDSATILHCAIRLTEDDEGVELVKYILENIPNCLEKRSRDGYTPLLHALSVEKVRFAEVLIKAGANIEARDRKGNNILHVMMSRSLKPGTLKTLLGLLDPHLITSLLMSRSSEDPGSLTPFASWIRMIMTYRPEDMDDEVVETAKLLLDSAEHTGQAHLNVLDGAGNTPVHNLVRFKEPRLLELMLERHPDLL